MPGDKYLRQNAGVLTEVVATQTSAGAGDANKIPALDATGKLDTTLMPVGIGADTNVIQASEALAAGDFVNVWNNAGAFRARKADASAAGKEANGFVLAAVANGANATIYSEGSNTQVSGQTAGAVFLSATTAGQATATPPSAAGQVVQRIGTAVSTTSINFDAGPPIVLA